MDEPKTASRMKLNAKKVIVAKNFIGTMPLKVGVGSSILLTVTVNLGLANQCCTVTAVCRVTGLSLMRCRCAVLYGHTVAVWGYKYKYK